MHDMDKNKRKLAEGQGAPLKNEGAPTQQAEGKHAPATLQARNDMSKKKQKASEIDDIFGSIPKKDAAAVQGATKDDGTKKESASKPDQASKVSMYARVA